MKLRGALQVVCTTLLMWVSGMPVASSATRSIVLLFDERPELPGSEILFREPNIRETYRWPILAVCTVLLLQGCLITLLMLERHRRSSAEMEARQRMVELAHVNRFSTAGEMAAGIAHEINQPLGAILNNAETAKIMLKSQSPDLEQIEEIVDDIQRDNGRATEVIGRLRSFMKKVPFEKKNFDLNDEVAKRSNSYHRRQDHAMPPRPIAQAWRNIASP